LKNRPQALVTGGAVRVGRSTCIALADAGYQVIVHANRSIEQARALAEDIDGLAVQSDLSEKAGVDELFAQIDHFEGQLSVLVNNAATFEAAKPEALSEAMWNLHVNLNLAAPFWCAQAAYKRFGNQDASIVNMIDIAALSPEPGYVHYAATKAGLISLTKGLARSWAPRIRVNGVSPGPVLVPAHYDEKARQQWLENLPMGSALGPQDVAETVRFLVEGPRGITGEIITVDGGWTTTI
jgi:pteridine reductase